MIDTKMEYGVFISCKGCGKKVERIPITKKYCTKDCYTKNKFKSVPKIKCTNCKKEFNRKSYRQKFCSVVCKDEYRLRGNSLLVDEINCRNCNVLFMSKTKKQIHCSIKCSNLFKNNPMISRLPAIKKDEVYKKYGSRGNISYPGYTTLNKDK